MNFIIARPFDKALKTQALFAKNGLQSTILPAIEIERVIDDAHLQTLNKASPNIIIVTSSYAADWLNEQVSKQALTFDINQLFIACVGTKTAKTLSLFLQKERILCAEQENSEGLLKLPCFSNIEGVSIVLLKGKGGRQLIIDTLTKNKATLAVIDVYQRTKNMQAIQSFTFEQSTIQCMIATSVEIVTALLEHSNKNNLLNMQWIVASERIKDYAFQSGILNIVVSQGASDQALLRSAQKIVNTGAVND